MLNGSQLEFYIEYIDANNIERKVSIRPINLGIKSGKDIEKLKYFKNSNGEAITFNYDYRVRDVNYWFFLYSGLCSSSELLSRKLLEDLYNYKKSNVKNPELYDKKYKNDYIISKLQNCSLRMNAEFIKAYSTFDFSMPTGDGKMVNIPILFSDSYKAIKSNNRLDSFNRQNFELLNIPPQMYISHLALEKIIKNFYNVDESKMTKQDMEFRLSVKKYIAQYLKETLATIKENLTYRNNNGECSYDIARVDAKLSQFVKINRTGGNFDPFIKDVVLNDAESILLAGPYKHGSVTFYVFIANLLTQLKTHELAKAVDNLGTRKEILTKYHGIYKDGLFAELSHKSFAEIYNNDFKILKEREEREKLEKQQVKTSYYQPTIEEAMQNFKFYYPDMTEEEFKEFEGKNFGETSSRGRN